MKEQHHGGLDTAITANKDSGSSLTALLHLTCALHTKYEVYSIYKMDNKGNTEDQQKAPSQPPSIKSHVTSSDSSTKSLASLAAAKAHAKAEAARARSTFVKRETELMVEKAQLKVEEARMEAALTTLKQEEELAAALTEAEILESAVAELGSKAGSVEIAGIPHDSREKRPSDYVACHSRMYSSQQSLPHAESNTAPNPSTKTVSKIPITQLGMDRTSLLLLSSTTLATAECIA